MEQIAPTPLICKEKRKEKKLNTGAGEGDAKTPTFVAVAGGIFAPICRATALRKVAPVTAAKKLAVAVLKNRVQPMLPIFLKMRMIIILEPRSSVARCAFVAAMPIV